MISIIIPAYNVQAFLERCVDSILQQDNFEEYQNQIEIIIINDGSTDKTEKIASNYVEKYNFVKLYSQNNGGLSAARNFGISVSSRKYIWFIDSDDWIAPNSLKIIFEQISAVEIDILEFDVVYAIDQEQGFTFRKDEYYSSISTELISNTRFLENEGYIVSVTSKLIKKSLFDQHDIHFPLNRFSEDNLVALKLMLAANNYKKISADIYFYYQRMGSITNTKNLNHTRKYVQDQILNCQDIDRELLNYSFDKSKIRGMQSFIISNVLLSILNTAFSNAETRAIILQLKSANQYPIKPYTYYNQGLKRKLFRVIFNNSIFITAYKFLSSQSRSLLSKK